MMLIPLLARLGGRQVTAFVRNIPTFLNSRGTSTRGRPIHLGNRRISQRRRPCTAPVAVSHPIPADGGGQRRSATIVRSFSAYGSGGAGSTAGPGDMAEAREALKTLFGHDQFRDGQVRGVHYCGNGFSVSPLKTGFICPSLLFVLCVSLLQKGGEEKSPPSPYIYVPFGCRKIMFRGYPRRP